MKNKKKIISDKKLRGEWAELCFMVRALEHGLQISKPWGEMRTYDFVLGRPSCFVAVQVKSTIFQEGGGYRCTVRGGHTSYPAGSFDFLAAYAALEDAWYIIPEAEIDGKESIPLHPGNKNDKYEPYREAWHLLRNVPSTKKVDQIQACAHQVPLFWVEVAQPVSS